MQQDSGTVWGGSATEEGCVTDVHWRVDKEAQGLGHTYTATFHWRMTMPRRIETPPPEQLLLLRQASDPDSKPGTDPLCPIDVLIVVTLPTLPTPPTVPTLLTLLTLLTLALPHCSHCSP